ncbi:hypothetical protein EKO23_11330 [Nocardioides guangzhouensis]|uniref:Lipoprotein n=1 Tax=Nocardioides guangzhouensis TaxID=2497878 RepID=A0A4Q4ZCV1_9ACTN|nr:DUF6281 family protein [Nocardioides guangzhouensis]RYP85890.1 hypothetical protein EKO23_11330 [Nocardioides guangzhouensis]
MLLVVAALLALAGCGSGAGPGSGSGDAASCAALIRYDGHDYLGTGELRRTPATTGRTLRAAVPGCDDTGEQGPAPHDEAVRVEELAGIDPDVAVLWNGAVFVRRGRMLPPSTRVWFRAPWCTSPGQVELTGAWLGVTGPRKPRFDGDLRPPYRLALRVTDGPAAYVGATVTVHATADTDPALTRKDAEQALWDDGQLVATVRCAAGRFEATALRTVPAG